MKRTQDEIAALIKTAREMEKTGMSLGRISRVLNVSWAVLQRHIGSGGSQDPITKDELISRLAQIPDDTRSFTGAVCGDPLPGRSALDQRRAG